MWIETEFENEMELEKKQLEQELNKQMSEYNLPAWNMLDDSDESWRRKGSYNASKRSMYGAL